MSGDKVMRLSQVARKLNVGRDTIVEFLVGNGIEIDRNPNAKINPEQYTMLAKEFASSLLDKEEAEAMNIGGSHHENLSMDRAAPAPVAAPKEEESEILITNLSAEVEAKEEVEASPAAEPEPEAKAPEAKAPEAAAPEAPEPKASEAPKLKGFKVLGKIDLDAGKKKPEPTPEPKVEVAPEAPKETTPAPAAEEKAPTETPKEEVKAAPPASEAKAPAPTPKEAAPATPAAAAPEVKAEEAAPKVEAAPPGRSLIKGKAATIRGLKVLGTIELPKATPKKGKPVASSDLSKDKKKRRKRIPPVGGSSHSARGGVRRPAPTTDNKRTRKRVQKEEPTDKEIQEQIKATLARLSGGTKAKGGGAKYRREKRSAAADAKEEQTIKDQESATVLRLTEFISASDLASLMDVSVNDVISTCMTLGMFVSINQRLDAEAITVITDEFGFTVEFTTADEEIAEEAEAEDESTLEPRAPIVTIMGHVDHGKTSLLDYIRKSSVTEGEAGGITQHIGAYDVTTEDGNKIAFLDTPGHEAFTAMRARGAQLTDVVIIVIAADDAVMPQTKEAINHAQVAGSPIIIAINKIDRPNANVEKIKDELSQINILVEDWGGKYQVQEISAKTGEGIGELLEKVLLETELLELKANPNKNAVGSVIEATLDKGRGYVTTIMVQSGTLKIGNVLLAGSHYGRVKAMFNHKGEKLTEAGPSTPVLMLGLNGAAQAGEALKVTDTEREARELATSREQIEREQSVRTKKHITLDEIGRRLAIGNFKELNVIVKGDVDGSIEALSDSLLKLSTDEVQVNIIHKGVGQISESDVLLATASDAIIIGFQVRPSSSAKKIAETEAVEIRLYSIIYDAINDVKDAMEGMLAPAEEEVIVGNVQIRDIFKISKVGTVAGCMVIDGVIKRANNIRVIRDGIVVYSGEMGQLKRFKDDVQEVKSGYECGLSIKGFNDLEEGDVVESYEVREIKRKL
jgi:translation initiation factor IF-2